MNMRTRGKTFNTAVRLAFVWLAISLLGIDLAACGSSGKERQSRNSSGGISSSAAATMSTRAAPRMVSTNATPARTSARQDRDKDSDSPNLASYFDNDDYSAPNYPHAADASDRHAVTAVVKRYFEAAVANEGDAACSLIYSLFEETIVEDYGQPPAGPPALRGTTCGAVMSKLFRLSHSQLVAETRTLEVANVRVKGRRGLALLRFKTLPGRRIEMRRERGAWKVDALLATELS